MQTPEEMNRYNPSITSNNPASTTRTSDSDAHHDMMGTGSIASAQTININSLIVNQNNIGNNNDYRSNTASSASPFQQTINVVAENNQLSTERLTLFISAIKKYYQSRATICAPAFKKPQPIKSCYINLSVVESAEQKLKELSLQKQEVSTDITALFEEISKPKTLISTLTIIETLASQHHQENNIVIWGNPGIGKSTFCHALTHEWSTNIHWQNLFSCVFWLPLRHLNNYRVTENKEQLTTDDIAQFIYYVLDLEMTDKSLMQNINTNSIMIQLEQNSQQTLFILDGADEAAHLYGQNNFPGKLLKTLLKRRHLLTSRPDEQSAFYYSKHFEIIGFTDENIPNYIEQIFELNGNQAESARQLSELLKDNPGIWGIAHIPILLAFICNLWSTANAKSLKGYAISELYLEIIYKLQLNYFVEQCGITDANQWDLLAITTMFEPVSEFLEDLAWQATQENSVLITPATLHDTLRRHTENLTQHVNAIHKTTHQTQSTTSNVIEIKFNAHKLIKTIVRAGLLKPFSDSNLSLDGEYYFIHSTFQECFAALKLVKLIAAKNNKPSDDPLNLEQFIRINKFAPRYRMIWPFVGGILSIKKNQTALHWFFSIFLSAPHDIIGHEEYSLYLNVFKEIKDVHNLQDFNKIIVYTLSWIKAAFSADLILQYLTIRTFRSSMIFLNSPHVFRHIAKTFRDGDYFNNFLLACSYIHIGIVHKTIIDEMMNSFIYADNLMKINFVTIIAKILEKNPVELLPRVAELADAFDQDVEGRLKLLLIKYTIGNQNINQLKANLLTQLPTYFPYNQENDFRKHLHSDEKVDEFGKNANRRVPFWQATVEIYNFDRTLPKPYHKQLPEAEIVIKPFMDDILLEATKLPGFYIGKISLLALVALLKKDPTLLPVITEHLVLAKPSSDYFICSLARRVSKHEALYSKESVLRLRQESFLIISSHMTSEDPSVRSSAAVAVSEYGNDELKEQSKQILRTLIHSGIQDKKLLYFCVSSLMLYLCTTSNDIKEFQELLFQHRELITDEEERFMSTSWPGKGLGLLVKIVNLNGALEKVISDSLLSSYFDKNEIVIPILYSLSSFAKPPLATNSALQAMQKIIIHMLEVSKSDAIKQALYAIASNHTAAIELLESLVINNRFMSEFAVYIECLMSRAYTLNEENIIDRLILLFEKLLHEDKLNNESLENIIKIFGSLQLPKAGHLYKICNLIKTIIARPNTNKPIISSILNSLTSLSNSNPNHISQVLILFREIIRHVSPDKIDLLSFMIGLGIHNNVAFTGVYKNAFVLQLERIKILHELLKRKYPTVTFTENHDTNIAPDFSNHLEFIFEEFSQNQYITNVLIPITHLIKAYLNFKNEKYLKAIAAKVTAQIATLRIIDNHIHIKEGSLEPTTVLIPENSDLVLKLQLAYSECANIPPEAVRLMFYTNLARAEIAGVEQLSLESLADKTIFLHDTLPYFDARAKAFLTTNQIEESVKCWKRQLEIEPKYGSAGAQLAKYYYERSDISQVIKYYHHALEGHFESWRIHPDLACCYHARSLSSEAEPDDIKNAKQQFENGLAYGKKAGCVTEYAKMLCQLGEYESAIGLLEFNINQNSKSRDALQYALIEKLTLPTEMQIELANNNNTITLSAITFTYYLLFICHSKTKNNNSALVLFEKLIQEINSNTLNSDSGFCYTWLGYSLLGYSFEMFHYYDNALACFTKAALLKNCYFLAESNIERCKKLISENPTVNDSSAISRIILNTAQQSSSLLTTTLTQSEESRNPPVATLLSQFSSIYNTLTPSPSNAPENITSDDSQSDSCKLTSRKK